MEREGLNNHPYGGVEFVQGESLVGEFSLTRQSRSLIMQSIEMRLRRLLVWRHLHHIRQRGYSLDIPKIKVFNSSRMWKRRAK